MVFSEHPIDLQIDLRILPPEEAGELPVGRGHPAVQQAGFGEEKGAGAGAGDFTAAPVAFSHPPADGFDPAVLQIERHEKGGQQDQIRFLHPIERFDRLDGQAAVGGYRSAVEGYDLSLKEGSIALSQMLPPRLAMLKASTNPAIDETAQLCSASMVIFITTLPSTLSRHLLAARRQ